MTDLTFCFQKNIFAFQSRKHTLIGLLITTLISLGSLPVFAIDYYFHPTSGNDDAAGTSEDAPFRSLSKIASLKLKAGDHIFLAAGEVFQEGLILSEVEGSDTEPILISSYGEAETYSSIDAKGVKNAVLLENVSYVAIQNLQLSADGRGGRPVNGEMRIGVLVRVTKDYYSRGITLEALTIKDVFFEDAGFQRGVDEVRTANGTQSYGWGIRVMNQTGYGIIEDLTIRNCRISNVSHTGIKLTGGKDQNIRDVLIEDNRLTKIGGPGIQMSRVKLVHVRGNEVMYSGSADDSRKWGRGSGLWTWGSTMVLIEHNKFMFANGPGDSAGAHIDFDCDNVVLQYNLSAYNSGGFCEILGNNYNCAYRYNVSINDGQRIKGKNGAFQEGKVFWLSGYVGKNRDRKGPVNSYIYNNTIYVSDSIHSRIAVEKRSRGVLVANNIFHLAGGVSLVKGDQYRPDDNKGKAVSDVFFKNNIFVEGAEWPEEAAVVAKESLIGNAGFMNPGGLEIEDYIPQNHKLIQQGIEIPFIPHDNFGLIQGLHLKKDILGNKIEGITSIGAIQVK